MGPSREQRTSWVLFPALLGLTGCQLIFDFGDRELDESETSVGGSSSGGEAGSGSAAGIGGVGGGAGSTSGGSAGSASGGTSSGCSELAQRCTDNRPEICNAGNWVELDSCALPTPVCSAGICRAVSELARGNAGAHSCVLLTDGSARCWGQGARGQLGAGTLDARSLQPRRVELDGITSLAVGFQHSCAVVSSGDLYCWGDADDGVIPGATGAVATPRQVEGLSGVQQISLGEHHACALLDTGRVSCWGLNNFGQLGRGEVSASGEPGDVSNLAEIQELAAGSAHTCARLRFGQVRCWGRANNGQLGHGFITDQLRSPVTTTYATGEALDDVVALSSGAEHTCAKQSLVRVLCWGRNDQGQLANNEFSAPYSRATDSFVEPPHVGGHTSCTLSATGLVECAGANDRGQLGNGTMGPGTNQNHEEPIEALSTVAQLEVHGAHACALLADGSVWCWGANEQGQLGNRQTGVGESTPVAVVW